MLSQEREAYNWPPAHIRMPDMGTCQEAALIILHPSESVWVPDRLSVPRPGPASLTLMGCIRTRRGTRHGAELLTWRLIHQTL